MVSHCDGREATRGVSRSAITRVLDDDEIFLASADWMTRNLDKRIEVMFPVEDERHKRTVAAALGAMFKDNVKARRLESDGTYKRVRRARGDAPFRVQQFEQEEARRAATQAQGRAGVTFQRERGDST